MTTKPRQLALVAAAQTLAMATWFVAGALCFAGSTFPMVFRPPMGESFLGPQNPLEYRMVPMVNSTVPIGSVW